MPRDPVELQLNRYVDCDQERPAVGVSLEGSIIASWQSCGSAGSDFDGLSIQIREFDGEDPTLGESEVQANLFTASNQLLPAIAVDRSGSFVVTWQSDGSFGSDSDGYSIQARRFSEDGTPKDPAEYQVNSHTPSFQQRPSVATRPDGSFVVAWDSWGGTATAYDIRARRFSPDGVPLDVDDFVVNTVTPDSQMYPRVAALAGGEFVVVWQDHSSPMSTLKARRFDADGEPLDPVEFQVNALPSNVPRRPAIAATPRGDFVVAWEPQFSEIHVRRFGSDGSPLDPVEFRVDSGGPVAAPALAEDSAGNFAVAWQAWGSAGDDDSYYSVQARRFRWDGTAIDALEVQANTYTLLSQSRPAVAAGPRGDFVLAWQSRGSFEDDNDGLSIQARRFGLPIIAVTSTSSALDVAGCTLRDAIAAANSDVAVGECSAGSGGAEIELPFSSEFSLLAPEAGLNGLPVIRQPTIVRGRGSRIERDSGLACPAGPQFRLFEIVPGGLLTLENLVISNGCLTSDAGAGAAVTGGTLVLRKATVEGNDSASEGGGVAVLDGNLLVLDSTIRGNVAGTRGGGISATAEAMLLAIRRTTVEANVAPAGGGFAYLAHSTGHVENATFSGNQGTAGAGAIWADVSEGKLAIDFTTITRNSSSAGSAIQIDSGALAVHNSLVGDQLKGDDCAGPAGSLAGSGLNLDTDGSCAAIAGMAFYSVPSLGLGALADNGGPNRSHLPLAGSPAIDAAPACSGPFGDRISTDQRGYPRPTDDDGDAAEECELGATERGPIFLDGFDDGSTTNWSY